MCLADQAETSYSGDCIVSFIANNTVTLPLSYRDVDLQSAATEWGFSSCVVELSMIVHAYVYMHNETK